MIQGKSVLAVIPARGGSKGVPGKNIRELAGKPLIAWTIEAAKKSRYIDRLVLSSDDENIIRVAEMWGCEAPFVRPAELARDETPGVVPLLHALDMLPGYDYVVLLQPTSPLRLASDIDACLERCLQAAAPACVTVVEPSHHPYWTYVMAESGGLSPLFENAPKARQQLPKALALNGAVYVASVEHLLASGTLLPGGVVGSEMPAERSLDIDTESDFIEAETMMRLLQKK